ncbi:transposable element Tcb1 transposase [Trichonephila clavipes]|nr:transposable element Tcb1 transposase [Trichonephila clavipes]
MVWGRIRFDHRTPLVHSDGCLTTDRYVKRCEACCSVLCRTTGSTTCVTQSAPITLFHLDNARSHVTRRILNSLIKFNILPWTANSPNLNVIEHLWDLIGCDMNRGPLE